MFGADAKVRLQKCADAVADYDMVVQLEPNFIDAYISRALLKCVLQRRGSAKRDFQRALKLAKEFGEQELTDQIEAMMHDLL